MIPVNTSEGEYALSVVNSVGNSASRPITVAATCLQVGEVWELRGGGIERQLPDGSWQPLGLGDAIRQNDLLRTPANGYGVLHLDDETYFALGRDTELRVDDLDFDPETTEGRGFFSYVTGFFVYVSGMIQKEQDPDNLVIETPVASLGIRGTQFFTQVDPIAEIVEIVEIALMHGSLAVTPSATGLESVREGPIALTITSSGTVSVPEPATGRLLAAGVAALLGLAMHRGRIVPGSTSAL